VFCCGNKASVADVEQYLRAVPPEDHRTAALGPRLVLVQLVRVTAFLYAHRLQAGLGRGARGVERA